MSSLNTHLRQHGKLQLSPGPWQWPPVNFLMESINHRLDNSGHPVGFGRKGLSQLFEGFFKVRWPGWVGGGKVRMFQSTVYIWLAAPPCVRNGHKALIPPSLNLYMAISCKKQANMVWWLALQTRISTNRILPSAELKLLTFFLRCEIV